MSKEYRMNMMDELVEDYNLFRSVCQSRSPKERVRPGDIVGLFQIFRTEEME